MFCNSQLKRPKRGIGGLLRSVLVNNLNPAEASSSRIDVSPGVVDDSIESSWLDESLQQTEVFTNFEMRIEDVFNVKGRGVVGLDTIERGAIHRGPFFPYPGPQQQESPGVAAGGFALGLKNGCRESSCCQTRILG